MNVLERQASIHNIIPQITDKNKLEEVYAFLWALVDEPEQAEAMSPFLRAELEEALEESYDESKWTTLEETKSMFAEWTKR